MPNFERTNFTGKSPGSDSYSYEKLVGRVASSADNSPAGKTNKVSVVLQDSYNYYDKLQRMPRSEYKESAGCDLSAVFMPFGTQSIGSGLPGFVGLPPKTNYGITMQKLFPFEYASGNATVLKDKIHAASGDSLGSVVSFNKYPVNINSFRSLDDIRSMGIRLPAMGVGWGYTKEKQIAWPSGSAPAGQVEGTHYPSGTTFFQGGYQDGYNVDPSHYPAAPIDFRYDEERNVWTCFSTDIVRFKITQTPVEGTPTIALCKKYNGIETRGPEVPIALEVTHVINQEVYAVIPVGGVYRDPSYQGEKVIWQEIMRMPSGQYEHMHYQMLANNAPGWGLPMGHPILNIVET
jgi:hypothetical protein